MGTSGAPSGVGAYGAFLKDELAAQDARKASLEQRGLAVITSAGVLGTLILALAALSTQGRTNFVLPDTARPWLAGALILFVLCAIAALGTSMPLRYKPVTADAIRKRLKETPVRGHPEAELDIALTRAKTLTTAKRRNGIKARLLFVALALEVLALACVGVAVVISISSKSPTTHVIQGPPGRQGRVGPTGPRGPRGYPAPPDDP